MDERTAIIGVGNTITIAAGKGDTGGAFALLDYELAPGYAGLPPHTHSREDAAAYVLEGTLLVHVGETERLVGPGEFIYLPCGVVHSQSNPGQVPARFLVLLLPAGFEQCFHDLDALLANSAALSPETIAPVLAQYGVRLITGAVQLVSGKTMPSVERQSSNPVQRGSHL